MTPFFQTVHRDTKNTALNCVFKKTKTPGVGFEPTTYWLHLPDIFTSEWTISSSKNGCRALNTGLLLGLTC